MKYFGSKNTLAKYIWKDLKNRSNEICIKRESPVLKITSQIGCEARFAGRPDWLGKIDPKIQL